MVVHAHRISYGLSITCVLITINIIHLPDVTVTPVAIIVFFLRHDVFDARPYETLF
jgi:hypothetical protein